MPLVAVPMRMLVSGLLAVSLLLPCVSWADASSRLTRIWVNLDGNIEMEVQGLGFDPLMRLERAAGGMYHIIIDGDDVALGDSTRASLQQFSQDLSRKVPAIAGGNYYQRVQGSDGIRIVLNSYRRLQPQVLSNSGSRILITLVGDRSMPPSVLAKQQPKPAPVQPKSTANPSNTKAVSVRQTSSTAKASVTPAKPVGQTVKSQPAQARNQSEEEREKESLYLAEQRKLERQRQEEARRQMALSSQHGSKKMVVVPPAEGVAANPTTTTASKPAFDDSEVMFDPAPAAREDRIPLDPQLPPMDDTPEAVPVDPIKLKSQPPSYQMPDDAEDGASGMLDQPLPQPQPAVRSNSLPQPRQDRMTAAPAQPTQLAVNASPLGALHSSPIDEGVAGAIVRQAKTAVQEGNLAGAQSVLETHLASMPGDAEARYLLAQIHLTVAGQSKDAATARSRRQAAMDELNRIINAEAHLPAYLSLMDLYFADANMAQAQALLDRAAAQWPNEPVVMAYKGQAQEMSGNLEAAREAYTQAIAAEPGNAEFHYRLAMVEMKSGRFEAARWQLSRALAIAPDDTRLWKLMGYIAERENNPDAAGEFYRKALNPDAMINYGRLLQHQRQTQKALVVYEAVAQMAPDDPDILFNLGMIYADMKQKQRAENILEHYLKLQERLPADSRHPGVAKAKAALSALK